MVDDQVLLSDCSEGVAAMLADAFRIAWIIGYEFQIGPLETGKLAELIEGQHTVHQKHLVISGRQRLLDEAGEFRRGRRLDFQSDHGTPAPTLERGFKQANQILRLFLDLNFGIANDS